MLEPSLFNDILTLSVPKKEVQQIENKQQYGNLLNLKGMKITLQASL